MTVSTPGEEQILILGIGNLLLQDDGVGIHLVNALEREGGLAGNILLRDGGTIGLSLLPDIEQADRLLVLDAAHFGGQPGEWAAFHNAEMDAHLSKSRTSVHEVALSDLFDAARLRGCLPTERVLIGIEPACIEWGMEPTEQVAAVLPEVLAHVREQLRSWCDVNAHM